MNRWVNFDEYAWRVLLPKGDSIVLDATLKPVR